MATLAGPSSSCCIKAVSHTGTARGTIEPLGGIDTYISTPPQAAVQGDARKIVLWFPDIYGAFFLNSQLIMDWFAEQGYLIVAPDYFFGDPVTKHLATPGFSIDDWIGPKMEAAVPAVPGWVDAVKQRFGTPTTKYVTVGYCFGAPFVMNHLAEDWVLAGAFAHPAFLDEDHFHKAKKPLLLSCAEVDHTFPTESRRRAVDILIEKKATYHVQLFSGVKHGFALRANLDQPIEKFAKEKSAEGILEWFNLFTA